MEYFIVCVILVSIIFISRETFLKRQANELIQRARSESKQEYTRKLKHYREQMAVLSQVNTKNTKIISIKNEKIVDLITEVNERNDKVDQLNKLLASNYSKSRNNAPESSAETFPTDSTLQYQQLCQIIKQLKENEKDSKLINNKLTFNYLLKKEENKHLSHDINLYIIENNRLQKLVADLLTKLNEAKSNIDSAVQKIEQFEGEWICALERNKNDIYQLKKTILKKHIQISNKLTKEQFTQQTTEFVEQQLRLNKEVDMKNDELMKLKELFTEQFSMRSSELNKLFTNYKQELQKGTPLAAEKLC